MSATNVSGLPLWGQAWTLQIQLAGGTTVDLGATSWDVESLRVTFDVLQAMNRSPLWYADINVYNMDATMAADVAANAVWVTLQAGFQSGPQKYTTIWNGPVFQTLFSREAVVDQRLTLHCAAIPGNLAQPTSFSMGPNSTQQHLVDMMIRLANLPPVSPAQGTQGQVAAQRMGAVTYPRGNTVFGTPSKYFEQLGDSNFLQTWNDGKQAYISEALNSNLTPSYIYAPASAPDQITQQLPQGATQSIIGTPEQTQEGVNFTVLLDPRLAVQVPPLVVRLAGTQIVLITRTPGIDSPLPTSLQNLVFFVTQVRHHGDTRGNDWCSEVTGWSTAYADTLLNLYSP
jgi:hypothetical protein